MNKWLMPTLSSLLFLIFIGSITLQVHAVILDGSMRLDMVRTHGPGEVELPHTREMTRRDIIRYRTINGRHQEKSRKGLSRRKTRESLDCENGTGGSVEMPMISGRDFGIGQYVVEVKVGMPPKKFKLIADTGSELTWMVCWFDRRRPRRRRPGVFLPAKSSTFTTIPCSSSACKVDLMNLFSLARCPNPTAPCAYDFRYMDGSGAKGIFGIETVTAELSNGAETKLEKVLIGCSESIQGSGLQAVDGVLGMAFSDHSFAEKAAREFEGKFSYCLVDHLSHMNVSSYLTFGKRSHSHGSPLLANMRYTKLMLGEPLSPLYGVDVLGISIGGAMLGIPIQVWAPNSGGGTIVDSGTSLTVLTAPAYELIVGALKESLSRYRRVTEDLGPLDYCFDSSGGFDESLVPRLVVHFKDGASFEPLVKSYVIDAAPGIKCLGLISASWPGLSVIGNIMQQNHVWEFDLTGGKLGFAPSSCT